MSYDSIKSGIKELVEALKLAVSDQVVDFETASPSEFGNTYILFPENGSLQGISSETLADRVYDTQTWTLQVAYSRGIHSGMVELDELNRKRQELITAIDNPTNWTSFARMLNVTEWEIETFEHYFVLNIKIEITDTITY